MKYNPQVHHRRSIRLKGYDYSRAGAYFITICCENMKYRFGNVDNNEMILNDFGKIAFTEWTKLPERFSNFELDVFQIMPNHMHGIIILNDSVGATLAVSHLTIVNSNVAKNNIADLENRAGVNPAPTIGDIVGAYKSLVSNGCLEIFKSKNTPMGKLWQRNYFEHIIRNEKSYKRISEYILTNPQNWKKDKFFCE